jgi:ATP-dependent RNA helicase DeaD
LESEEREAATGRSQNVVHVLPQSVNSLPHFLTGPLERIDPVAGHMQLLVITVDSESAVALAEAVPRLTGLGGIEVFPVTSARRAARLSRGRPLVAMAGAPADLAELIRGTHLKMSEVRTVVLAWADDLFEGNPEATAALELVMTELPRDATRVLVTDKPDHRVDAFVERYLRRARRMDEMGAEREMEPVSLQYVTVSPTSRLAGLGRVLDEIDPPSAEVIVASGEAELDVSALLRTLGYSGESGVKVSRGESTPEAHAVIFYGLPASRAQLKSVAAANPVVMIALVQPREVEPLKRLAGGVVKPLTLPNAGKTARDRERALRQELSAVLESGVPAREILALEPLLDRHDGIEIAAAALRLLERERSIRKNIEAAALAAKQQPPPRPGDSATRGGAPPKGRPGGRREGRPSSTTSRQSGSRTGSGGRPPRDRS